MKTEKEVEHIPTPFASISAGKKYNQRWFNFRDDSGMMTCNIIDSEMPCWEQIVHIVNSHEALLDAAKNMFKKEYEIGEDPYVALEKAISQAEGRS